MAGMFDDLIAEYGKSKSGGKALPRADFEELDNAVRDTRGFADARRQFREDYGGNVLGDVENWAQSLNGGIGTPGQRDWWAAQQSSDNIMRNALFGASLTGTEKASWEATTVNPRMDAAEIERNMTRRSGLLQEGLKRRVAYLKANGYDPAAIDATLGDTLKGAGFSVEEGANQFPGLPSAEKLGRLANRAPQKLSGMIGGGKPAQSAAPTMQQLIDEVRRRGLAK